MLNAWAHTLLGFRDLTNLIDWLLFIRSVVVGMEINFPITKTHKLLVLYSGLCLLVCKLLCLSNFLLPTNFTDIKLFFCKCIHIWWKLSLESKCKLVLKPIVISRMLIWHFSLSAFPLETIIQSCMIYCSQYLSLNGPHCSNNNIASQLWTASALRFDFSATSQNFWKTW